MRNAGGGNQGQLFSQRRDRRRAVRRIQHAARVWLECNQSRHRVFRGGGVLEVPDDLDVAAMYAVEAADRQNDGADGFRREPNIYLQRSTFSGTNVLRKGSAWPSATRRPAVS